MNNRSINFLLILLFVAYFSHVSCKKEEKQPPSVSTNQVSDILYTTANSGGKVLDEGTGPVVARGLCWSLNSTPTIEDYKSVESGGIGDFISKMTDLKPANEFYVRAYAVNLTGIAYGEEIRFTTLSIDVPFVLTKEVSSITSSTVNAGGDITNLNGGEIIEKGVCWNTSQNPTKDNNKIVTGYGPSAFNCQIKGLVPNTTYFLRAYAINIAGISYGNEVSFKSAGVPPVVTTSEITGQTINNAIAKGKVENDGGSLVTIRGFCWSLFHDPDTLDNKSANGTGTGEFTHEIMITPDPETKYYVRAYAKNIYGISYGNEVSFLSKKSIQVFTDSVSEITKTSAVVHGHVILTIDLPDASYGVCWSTSPFPTLNHNNKVITPVNGSMSLKILNLKPWTPYFTRFFVKTGNEVFYGDNLNFSTLSKDPEVFTDELSTTLTSSTVEGNTKVNVSGYYIPSAGASVSTYGFCWSKRSEPTIDDNRITGILNWGKFSATITNLELNTDYYLRAYVTDIYGTYYGNEKSFRISYTPPQAEGIAKFNYYYQNIKAIYQVTWMNSNSIPVLKFGVCWNTEPNPTLDNNKEETAYGNSVNFTISAITPGVQYYIRCYVANDIGTYYSPNMTFKSWYGQSGPQATDSDGNVYNSIKIGNQIWLTENLKTTKYLNGDPIGTTATAILDISGETEPKYQWPAGGNEINVPEYGRLYTWHVATESRKVCPAGWHVPSFAEWNELNFFICSDGGDMKETGLIHWNTPNSEATNLSGFKGIGSGYRNQKLFTNMKNYAMYWSTTPTINAAQYAYLFYNSDVFRVISNPSTQYSKSYGFSIRCLKDN